MFYAIQLANAISISAIVLFLLPWGFYVATNKSLFLWLGVVASLVDGSTKMWKWIFGTQSIYGRPEGACDCDILCTNGNQEGKPGFPSGHMTLASFIATTFAFIYPGVGSSLAAAGLVLVMGWARYVKKCHNLWQILVGTFYGFFVATFFMAIIDS